MSDQNDTNLDTASEAESAVEDLHLDELKDEATSLGLKFNKAIGPSKLKEKIDAYYEAQETSGPAIAKAVEKNEAEAQAKSKSSSVSVGVDPKLDKRRKREAAARKTRVVTVTDNDQRVNNHTNTCVVNCSNEFFDLGTKILPLNEKIEVCQGHINVLKSVQIPLHVKGNDGLAAVRMRLRYNISYEDIS